VTDIRMADVSEWQSNVDATAYLNAGYKCIIARTYSGYRLDKTMPGRRDYLRGFDFTALGWYAYLAQDVDAKTQARAFIDSVGTLKANEWPILDVEEGSGSQTVRSEAWFEIVDEWAGFPATLYASQYFFRDQLSGCSYWGDRPLWMAAYSSAEPSDPHDLWQYSDSYSFAGIGSCDGNLAHVGADDFLEKMRGGQGPAPKPEPPATDAQSLASIVKANGCIEIFAEEDGEVLHRWQPTPNAGTWSSWASMGTPGGK
jgi:GH25 family lysozyme M1 (1,4-beta-N-acetylmuramidase)